LKLQTLEASPLSNRRSERPAEKPPTNNKHSEEVPHLLQYDALILAQRFCFASILKNKSGKTKEFDSSFFRSTVYFARLCLGGVTNNFGECI